LTPRLAFITILVSAFFLASIVSGQNDKVEKLVEKGNKTLQQGAP
jgi:hypothetical protein